MTEERMDLITLLVVMTGKGESYFLGMSDKRLDEEYDRLVEPLDGI